MFLTNICLHFIETSVFDYYFLYAAPVTEPALNHSVSNHTSTTVVEEIQESVSVQNIQVLHTLKFEVTSLFSCA